MQAYQHQVRGFGENEAPAPSFSTPIQLGATSGDLIEDTASSLPMAAGYVIGGLLGAAAVGAGIGYVASGRKTGAITGAVAGAGVSATTSSLSELFYGRKLLGVGYGVVAVGALTYAWLRKP